MQSRQHVPLNRESGVLRRCVLSLAHDRVGVGVDDDRSVGTMSGKCGAKPPKIDRERWCSAVAS
jgi:hypothetical protein